MRYAQLLPVAGTASALATRIVRVKSALQTMTATIL